MKHSSVLVLGLTTLVLSSASAVHAKEFHRFTSTASFTPAALSDSFFYKPSASSAESVGKAFTLSQPSSRSRDTFKEREPTDSPNLPPLLESPPVLPPTSVDPSPKPSTPVATPSVDSSPFRSLADMEEEDLYEPTVPTGVERSPGLDSGSGSGADSNSDRDLGIGLTPGPSHANHPTVQSDAPPDSSPPLSAIDRSPSSPISTASRYPESAKPIGLDFGLDVDRSTPGKPATDRTATATVVPSPTDSFPTQPIPPPQPEAKAIAEGSLDSLFAGASDSIVAVIVGNAEGTRAPDGSKNPAYYGHTDPGNGVWNLGSFSYQHGATSPEEADTKQLTRLRKQAEVLMDKAKTKGMELSLEEKLNGIDLANQAPMAALESHGYIDWLAAAHAKGMTGSDAILWARVQSFIDPNTQTWDAPGLGNTESNITHDQERRMLAIAKALATYLQTIASHTQASPSG